MSLDSCLTSPHPHPSSIYLCTRTRKARQKVKALMKRLKRALRSIQLVMSAGGQRTDKRSRQSGTMCPHPGGSANDLAVLGGQYGISCLHPGARHWAHHRTCYWHMAAVLSVLHAKGFPIDFHSGIYFFKLVVHPIFQDQITTCNYVSSAHKRNKHLKDLIQVVSRHVT